MTDPYVARMVAFTEGRDPIEMQREMPALLQKYVSGASENDLRRSPAPGKWSASEIIAHLADSELVSVWRYRQMIEHDGNPLSAYDQDEWARIGNYSSSDARESLQLFTALRKINLQMFARLTPQEWQRAGMHAERGKISVEDLVRHVAGHDRNHLEQIQRILGAK
jgi:DinB family protein